MLFRLPAGSIRLLENNVRIEVPEGGTLVKGNRTSFELGDFTYPPGWLDTASPAELTALNVTEEERPPAPSAPPYQPTAANVQAEAARRLQDIGAAYSREERETWATQVDEAKALALDPAAAAPFLTARAAGRGVTAAQLAALVLTKADAFAQASGAILAAQDALAAMDPIPQDIVAAFDGLLDPS